MLACDEIAKIGSKRGIKFGHRRQPRRSPGHCGGRGRCSAMLGGVTPKARSLLTNCEAIYAAADTFGSTHARQRATAVHIETADQRLQLHGEPRQFVAGA